jgi:photosystem II stability/assembly factor-like uncharacterized protein
VRTVRAQINPTPASRATLDVVTFANAQHGWAAGKDVILGTDDGGSHWTVQYSGSLDITQLNATGPDDAWAVAASRLLGTSNGGAHWTTLGEPAGAALQSVDFVSVTVGFGVTSAGLVQTSDGGQTWRALPPIAPSEPSTKGGTSVVSASGLTSPEPYLVTSVCFSDPQNGWAALNPSRMREGAVGEVARTTNGGRTWLVSFAPHSASGVSDTVEQLGCSGDAAWVELAEGAGMSGQPYSVFRTSDGGVTWTPVLTVAPAGAGPGPGPIKSAAQGPDSSPGPLAVVGPDEAYFFGVCDACGDGAGTLQPASTTDGGSSWTTDPVVAGAHVDSTAGGSPAAAFVPGGRGWLVAAITGTQSAIFATSDGGRTWAEQYPTTVLEPLLGIDFISSTQGFGLGTLGDGAAILATTDGGRTWSRVGDLPDRFVTGSGWISFATAQNGWAAVASGTLVFSTSDGGAHWTALSLPKGTGPSDGGVLLTPNAGCLNAGDGSGAPLCTTDGGATWKTTAAAGAESAWTATAGLLGLPLAETLAGRYPKINAPITGGASGPDSAWLADALALYTTTDDGARWTRYDWPTGFGVPAAINFATPDHGWLIRHGLFATTDGGASWTQIGGA